jgi:hypothetical protein
MVITYSSSTQKNGKLRICIDFKKLNAATKKDPYPLPFIDEVLNTIVGYEIYSFLDGYLGYHQISSFRGQIQNYMCYRLGGFYMEGDVVWSQKWTSNISQSCYQNILKIFGQFNEDISR